MNEDKSEDVNLGKLKNEAGEAEIDNKDVVGIDTKSIAEINIKESDNTLVENCIEIKEYVRSDICNTLIEMGFGIIEAEKAIFFTRNAGLEEALSWIEENKDSEYLKDPIVQTSNSEDNKNETKLSDEEVLIKVQELQRKVRERRRLKEKEDEIEKEKRRISSAKQLIEAQRKLEEAERARHIQQVLKEKVEHEKERNRQLDLLRHEWEERFGCPYPEDEKKVLPKTGKEKVAFYCNKLQKEYKDTDRAGLIGCLTLLKTYISNVLNNPQEDKYKKIRLNNSTFHSKVARYNGSIDILKACGFEIDANNEFLIITPNKIPDTFTCGQAIRFIDLILRTFP
ncbi:hypothetical protein cand_028300 [Cryptosporidium andersoni]|uniref:Uncharacterized protein n=1 Tax=Cryptosporidium andersoni TaxID=117008 RepID=A0A1J4MR29_9CRYT|nr:hypothetical protein cand_028300 [Cryptosporidium andersoni]